MSRTLLFDRPLFKKTAFRYLTENHPVLLEHFNSVQLDLAGAFAVGYETCLIENVNPPVQNGELARAVSDAALRFLIERLKSKI